MSEGRASREGLRSGIGARVGSFIDESIKRVDHYALWPFPALPRRSAEAQRLLDLLNALGSTTFRQLLWQRASELDLTYAQSQVLFYVGEHAGCHMGDVAKAFGVTLPAVTHIIDRLEQKQFVVRGDHPADRRVYVLELTRAGQGAGRRSSTRIQMRGLERVLARMSADDRQRVVRGWRPSSTRPDGRREAMKRLPLAALASSRAPLSRGRLLRSRRATRKAAARRRRPCPSAWPPPSSKIVPRPGHRRRQRAGVHHRRRQVADRRPDHAGPLQGRARTSSAASCSSRSIPRPLEAALRQAEANVGKDTAQLRQTEAALGQRQAEVTQALANLERDVAQMENARVQEERYRDARSSGS